MFCTECGKEIESTAKFCAFCGTATVHNAPPAVPPRTPRVAALRAPATPAAAARAASVPEPSAQYAGFWLRAAALFIDTIISGLISVVAALPLMFVFIFAALLAGSSGSEGLDLIAELLGNLLGGVVAWLYFTISESSSWQATPGKKLLGLKVTDLRGERIGFGRANGRYWSKLISAIILLVGYIMAAFTEKKQGLHDMIADTLVVRS